MMKVQIRRLINAPRLAPYAAGLLSVALGSITSAATPTSSANAFPVATANIANVDLPSIGQWSIGSDGLVAHWLGALYNGKGLREPINVILVDDYATSAADAAARVMAAAKLAGYPVREGHSTGYQAIIGGARYTQLPSGRDFAFSNEPFELTNNHGRIFGPHREGRSWVFTAAFSREQVAPLSTPKHRYESFNAARDDFSQRMDQFTKFKIVRFVQLDNAIVSNPDLTTGDHDGIAVMLKVNQP